MAIALARPRSISLLGWVRVTIRIFCMAALLLAALPLYYLFRITGTHNPIPRLFLGGIG